MFTRLVMRNLAITVLVVLSVGLLWYVARDRGKPPAPPGTGLPRVLVFQDKSQEWADDLKAGFEVGLSELGLHNGRDLIITNRNAAAEPQVVQNLARIIADDDVAVVYALGTQASQTAFDRIKNKPVVFGAVTDPVAAGFYDGSLQKPKGMITGTQDVWPYGAQMDLIKALVPNLTDLGIVYNSSEVNSQVSVEFIKRECAKRQIRVHENTVADASQLSLAVSGLLQQQIQAFMIPADNTAQNGAQVIIAACLRRHVPVFTGISGIVKNGAIATVGTNYVELGKVNARQVAKILKGIKAQDIPVDIADKGDIYLNLKSAAQFGLTITEGLKAQAKEVY